MNLKFSEQEFHLTKSVWATKAIFLVCGVGLSSWAPMVPFTKDRLQLDDASIGILLLFLGAGAIITMPLSGILISRIGTRKVILTSVLIMATSLPLLLLMKSQILMAFMLFIFGAGIGNLDVAMNSHAVHIQNLSNRPIMSSLHGLFSVGGLLGPIIISFLLKSGVSPEYSLVFISILLMIISIWQYKHLMNKTIENEIIKQSSVEVKTESLSKTSWINSTVIYLGAMCFAVFLVEGAMLDWGAIYLRDNKGVEEALSGFGYAAFSVAMAIMRLTGDKFVAKFDSKLIVSLGSFIGFVGLLLIIFSSWIGLTLFGFVLVGIGAANIVPIFFSESGRIKNVSSSVALPAITTMGYIGQLAGPAILGFISQQTSLPFAFGFTCILLFFVGFSYYFRK